MKLMKRTFTCIFLIATVFISFGASAQILEVEENTFLSSVDKAVYYESINIFNNSTLTFGRGSYFIDQITGDGHISASTSANILIDSDTRPQGYVEIDIGRKESEENKRYFDINGEEYFIHENGDRLGIITEKNLIVKVCERNENENKTIKSNYYYIDAKEASAEKLPLDSFLIPSGYPSLKIKEPFGIRFLSSIKKDTFMRQPEFKVIEFGCIMATENALLKERKQLNFDFERSVHGIAYSEKDDIRIFFDTSNDFATLFSCVLINIPEHAYNEKIVSRSYSVISNGKEEFTVYGDTSSFSLYDVADLILNNNNIQLSNEDRKKAEKIVELSVNSKKIVDGGKCGDNLFWELDSNGTLRIFGNGRMYDYVKYTKPSPWYKYRYEPYISENGKTILNPDGTEYLPTDEYFENNPDRHMIKNIIVEEGVTYLGNWAFYRVCVDELTIPEGVVSTGHFAIRYSPTLKTVTLPDSLIELGDFGISRNQVLTTINFGTKLEKVGTAAFAANDSLTAALLPDSLILANLQLNEPYSSINYSAQGLFSGCASLTDVTLGSIDYIPGRTFLGCSSLKSVTVTNLIKHIDEYAFANCTGLEKVLFEKGSACTDIGYAAFLGCSSLKQFTGCTSLETVEYNAFNATNALEEFEFSEANKTFPKYMFYKSNIKTASLGSNFTVIPEGLFNGCKVLEELYISASVTQIDMYAITACTDIKSIYYGSTYNDWLNITKHENWARGSSLNTCTVYFSDGETRLLKDCI